MGQQERLTTLKDALAGQLLALEGVTGVGVGADALHVYLIADDPSTREKADKIIHSLANDVNVKYLVTGQFSAQ